MKADPKRRADDRCSGPGCNKLIKIDARYSGAETAATDPFCSANCCRRWHGLPLPEDTNEENQAEGNRYAMKRKFYSGDRPEPVGEWTREALLRDRDARIKLGIAA